jgi:hypothetical protein
MRLTILLSVIVAIFTSKAAFGAPADSLYMELSGELTGTLTSDRPYLVVGDIYVTPGSTVILDAGTVLLFDGFTGLHVQGTLYAKGTPEKPVIFTSKNDPVNPAATVTPAPFDWNGIDVYENAVGTDFTGCVIKYSVYGIRSQTGYLKIVNTIFSDNGKSDFTVKEERKDLERGVPFSYNIDSVASVLPELSEIQNASKSTVPSDPEITNVKKKNGSGGAKFLRVTGLLLVAGCGAYTGVNYFSKFAPAQKRLEDLSDLDETELRMNTSSDWELIKKDRDKYFKYSAIGAGGTLLGLLFFTISFAF